MNPLNQTIKRRLFLLAGLLTLVLLTSCVIDPNSGDGKNTRYSASEEFSNRFNVTTQHYFELRGINGPVEIIGTDNPTVVEIWGERKVESESKADAQANLQRLSVEIVINQDGIIAETRQPDETGGRNFIVAYYVRVPQNWLVYANNVNGNTSVESINNAVDVALTNGNLQVNSINGDATVSLVNGNLTLNGISGNVLGSLTNGNITAKVYLPLPGTCKLNTVNGNVALSVPQTVSAQFSARVSNGGISLTNLTLHNAITTVTSTSGVLGSGNGSIDLRTVNGSIVATGF